jgi:hypothetical protein
MTTPVKPRETLDPITESIQNNSCALCRSMSLPRPCKGHVRTGGGQSDGGEAKSSSTDNTNKYADFRPRPQPSFESIDSIANEWSLLLRLSENILDFQTGLLDISSDKLGGLLTIRGKPTLSKEELAILREYLNRIQMEFEHFKESLAERGTSVTNFFAVLKNDVLKITIPNPNLYLEFIHRLTRSNLLPSPHAEQASPEEALQKKTVFNPTPFETVPRPKRLKQE